MKFISRTAICCALPLFCSPAISEPVILRQPVNFSVSLGANITNQVTATGTSPIEYRWQLNGVDVGKNNRTLIVTNVGSIHTGSYVVVVSDASGSVTSRVATVDVDPTFTKVTSGRIVAPTGRAWGCSWGDYNDDGYIDLFVAGLDGNTLYRNSGDGSFAKVTSGPIVVNPNGGSGVAWVDYDNDGDLDLISGGSSGARHALYRNEGKEMFTKLTSSAAGALLNSGGNANAATVADFDNDGWIDVFIANRDFTADELFRGSPAGVFTRVTNNPVTLARTTTPMGVWGDFDNDRDADLVVVTHGDSKDRVFVYRNDSGGAFSQMSYDQVGTVFSMFGATGAAWGDFDNDGDSDLFLAPHLGHDDSLTDQILAKNNGDGTFMRLTTNDVGQIAVGRHARSCAWADYDNDGYLDLFVSNSGGHPGSSRGAGNRLYRNMGDGTFSEIRTGSVVNEPAWSWGAAWADTDNDGFMDLFVANGGGSVQENFFYRNNGNSNRWLKLKLVGTTSNRSAIGAKVRVKATICGSVLWQLRELSAGDGFMSQNDLRPNFGLGDASFAEVVRVEWPSGIDQELHNLSAGQIHTIIEPPRIEAITRTNAVMHLHVNIWSNFVFSVEASADLARWTPVLSHTNVTGPFEVPDPVAGQSQRQFYRIKVE